MSKPPAKLSVLTATSLVIASMIGTGVFTSIGFQVVSIKTGFSILLLWVLGGITAFCGAVTYAELGSTFPRSGGEYNLMTRLYGPSFGFIAGWVSATVGFAAPASLAAMALSSYMSSIVPSLPEKHFAVAVILILAFVHGSSVRAGSAFQNIMTGMKVLLIVAFVAVGFFVSEPQNISLLPTAESFSEVVSPPFAVALVFVTYAYTGWNSSVYVVSELDNPHITLPRSFFIGTAIVMALYISLNYIFLYTVPIPEMAGKVQVGVFAGQYIFGEVGGLVMAGMISILLLSTISAYIFLGPRIIQVIGEDFDALKWLSVKNKKGIPINAFVSSTILSVCFIYTSSFDQVLLYTSFLLILITTLTSAGIFIRRTKFSDLKPKYLAWGYPITPIVFITLNSWILIFMLVDKFYESMIGLSIIVVGFVFYFLVNRKQS